MTPAIVEVWLDEEEGGVYRATAWSGRDKDGYPDPDSEHWDIHEPMRTFAEARGCARRLALRFEKRKRWCPVRETVNGKGGYDARRAFESQGDEDPEISARVFRVSYGR